MSLPKLNPVGGALGPLVSTSPWDVCVIDGNTLPGRSRVRGQLTLKVDEKNAGGVHGGRPTYHGLEGKPVEIDVECWTDEQRDELARICAIILPKRVLATETVKKVVTTPAATNLSQLVPGSQGPTTQFTLGSTAIYQSQVQRTKTAPQKPVTIRHPSLLILGCVNQIVVEGASSLEPTGQRGWTRMTIHARHWLPPLKGATATPKSPTRNPSNVRAANDTNPTPHTQASTFAPPPGPRANG